MKMEIVLKILGFLILLVFYAIYIGKMLLQKRRGIQADQIAKGKQKNRVYYTEKSMKTATYSVVAVEAASILLAKTPTHVVWAAAGVMIGVAGDIIFGLAVMLHLQILQEESYLPGAFGEAYIEYRSRVCRYLGRKSGERRCQ